MQLGRRLESVSHVIFIAALMRPALEAVIDDATRRRLLTIHAHQWAKPYIFALVALIEL
jgi:hypothetical protein